jgi:DNA-binding MarR family transcriptional regulator
LSDKLVPPKSNADTHLVTLEDNVGVRVVRLADVFSRLARIGVEEPWGLRSTELRIVNMLDGTDSIPISEISRRTHVDKAWISRSVRDLEKRGLVARRGDASDARKSHALLTDAGRELLEKIRPLVVWNEKRVLEGIEEHGFKRDLDRLLQNADHILTAAEALQAERKK